MNNPTNTTDECRKAFEERYRKHGYTNFGRSSWGYGDEKLESLWSAWQAAYHRTITDAEVGTRHEQAKPSAVEASTRILSDEPVRICPDCDITGCIHTRTQSPPTQDVQGLVDAFEAVDKATSDIRMALPLFCDRDGFVRVTLPLSLAQPFMRNSADFCEKVNRAKQALAAYKNNPPERK